MFLYWSAVVFLVLNFTKVSTETDSIEDLPPYTYSFSNPSLNFRDIYTNMVTSAEDDGDRKTDPDDDDKATKKPESEEVNKVTTRKVEIKVVPTSEKNKEQKYELEADLTTTEEIYLLQKAKPQFVEFHPDYTTSIPTAPPPKYILNSTYLHSPPLKKTTTTEDPDDMIKVVPKDLQKGVLDLLFPESRAKFNPEANLLEDLPYIYSLSDPSLIFYDIYSKIIAPAKKKHEKRKKLNRNCVKKHKQLKINNAKKLNIDNEKFQELVRQKDIKKNSYVTKRTTTTTSTEKQILPNKERSRFVKFYRNYTTVKPKTAHLKYPENSLSPNVSVPIRKITTTTAKPVDKIKMLPKGFSRGIMDFLFPESRMRNFKDIFDTIKKMLSYTFRRYN